MWGERGRKRGEGGGREGERRGRNKGGRVRRGERVNMISPVLPLPSSPEWA